MKKIGLIGGISYISSLTYYKVINQEVQSIMGDHHSANIVLYSLNFDPIAKAMFNNDWNYVEDKLVEAVNHLKKMDCGIIAICCNSVHKVFYEVEKRCRVKLFHIMEPTAHIIYEMGLKKIGLLGTKFTMLGDFYKKYANKYNIDFLTPEKSFYDRINEIIFSEICQYQLSRASKNFLLNVINHLIKQGAQGIILACTELPEVIHPTDVDTILFPTTYIHAKTIAALYTNTPFYNGGIYLGRDYKELCVNE